MLPMWQRTSTASMRPRRSCSSPPAAYGRCSAPASSKGSATHPRARMACNDQWLTLPSDGTTEIYVMNADGSAVTRLTEDPQGEYQPTWSPDGTKIAFSRTHVYEDST